MHGVRVLFTLRRLYHCLIDQIILLLLAWIQCVVMLKHVLNTVTVVLLDGAKFAPAAR